MIDWATITGFQWAWANAAKSHDKHGIGCPEAESVFLASDLRILEDPQHSTPDEPRWHAFGTSAAARPLSITFTVRFPLIRIISARPINSRERKSYGYSQN
ncbi:MAG: BrnT family toxin [Verrucomicrobia bacterium]|nr:MAG: BrnT family toxin [Verrucomicrobiota bacterium]